MKMRFALAPFAVVLAMAGTTGMATAAAPPIGAAAEMKMPNLIETVQRRRVVVRNNYRPGRTVVVRRGYGPGWRRPGNYWWGPGAAIAAGAAVGVLGAAAVTSWAGAPPAPGYCWYYTDASRRAGFWDACP